MGEDSRKKGFLWFQSQTVLINLEKQIDFKAVILMIREENYGRYESETI